MIGQFRCLVDTLLYVKVVVFGRMLCIIKHSLVFVLVQYESGEVIDRFKLEQPVRDLHCGIVGFRYILHG